MHVGRIFTLNVGRVTIQKPASLCHLFGVISFADQSNTWPRTAFDLILQAWASAGLENIIAASAQHEGPCKVGYGSVDRTGGCEWTKIIALLVLPTPMFR